MILQKSKKTQFLIISASLILALLFFIYSIETENSYIVKSTKFNILDNIIYETCSIGKLSNGSYLDSRFGNFSINVNNYCNSFSFKCNLTITKNSTAPTNLSLLNYSYYGYHIDYEVEGYNYSGNFTC